MASKLTSTSSDTHKVCISNSGIQHANSLQTVRAKTLKEQLTSDKTPLLNGKEPKEGYCAIDAKRSLRLPTGYKGAYFQDKQRSIDMVLVFQCKRTESGLNENKKIQDTRKKFIHELLKHGLQIEIETVQHPGKEIYFIKLHAPLETLQSKAEDMKLKLPFSLLSKNPAMDVAISSLPFTVRDDLSSHNHRYFLLTPFVKQHAEKFMAKGECFSPLDRIAVVDWILNETRFSEEEFGVKRLVNQQVFKAVYPPRESGENVSEKHTKGRQKLAKDWASFRNILKKQPINTVKSYFGTSIAFYFVWLGFCSWCIWPLALVSLMVLVYGGLTLASYPPVTEICRNDNTTQFLMCPECKTCGLWYLNQVCATAKVSYVFINEMGTVLAILVSIWSLYFTKSWNRYYSKLAFQWQTYKFEKTDEAPRPEYVAKVKTTRRNIANGQLEKYVPITRLCFRFTLVVVTVILMICLSLAALLAVILYRSAVYMALIKRAHNQPRVLTDITAGVIILVYINILSWVYAPIARNLTNFENPRTQSQWEESFTYKMFAFQFVNWYSSLFYIAFFKTEPFTGKPGDYERFTIGGYRLEGCPVQGCSMELCIQLGVIMVGQLLLQNISEIFKPYLVKWRAIRKCKFFYYSLLPWQQEYFLTPADTLFWEYMEIVLQLGFVLMFSAAFPLAPLIAFINVMLEIRLDSMKFIHFQRRPIPKVAAASARAWQQILEQLAEWSVLVNALVIGMTTDFIPKLVHRLSYSDDLSLKGYVNSSLSFYNISSFPGVNNSIRKSRTNPSTFCRYLGYREINGDYSTKYWHIMTIRIVFVLLLYYSINALRKVLDWIVADESWNVEARRKRTIYFLKRLFKTERRTGIKAA